jgi:hypothetical protein
MRYVLGVLAGMLSGLVFTASSIAQKRAITAIGAETPLYRNLVKSPLWLSGFAAAFIIGAPLNMAAYAAIGPTLPPALNSIGLAALPILARFFLRERPSARSYMGAAGIAIAIACIGFSGIAIAPESVNWFDRSFLLRAAVSVGCIVVVMAACIGLGLLVSGRLGVAGLMIAGAASAALATVNFCAIAIAQLALRKGTAAVVIPIQQLPIKAVPLILHAALYRGSFGAAACLALLLATTVPGRLDAQEAAAPTRVYRYACLDDAGRTISTIEMLLTSRGGELEIVSTDSAGIRGFAKLGAGMLQEEVSVDGATGGTMRFKLAALGESWNVEGGSASTLSRAGNAYLGDRSLFFILPTLVDPKMPGDEARFVLVRPEGGQRATMRIRAEGIVDGPEIGGRKEKAYRIRMELADPLGRLLWPYSYNYYYRVGDLCFLAYDGPDEKKRNSKIVLVEVHG